MKQYRLYQFFLLCSIASADLASHAQSLTRQLFVSGLPNEDIAQITPELASLSDSSEIAAYVYDLIPRYHESGYLSAEVSKLSITPDTVSAHIFLGALYQWDTIAVHHLPDLQLDLLALPQLHGQPLNWRLLEKRLDRVLTQQQNLGYPFAAFTRTDLAFAPLGRDTILTKVAYQFDPGPLIVIDSILIKGEFKEDPRLIYTMTRLAPGMPFNQELLQDMPRVLNNTLYFEQVTAPQVTFTAYKTAWVELAVKQRKAGKLDLLVGFLPPPQPGDGRFEVIASADLRFISLFGQGDIITVEIDRLRGTSQQAKIGAIWPYVLRTPLSLEAQLELIQRNQDFLNVSSEWKAGYAFSPFLTANVFFASQNSRLLDSALMDTTNLSPNQLDGNRQLAGGGLRYESLDYRLNPTKGLVASLSASVGRRTIRRNTSLPEAIYDQLDLDQPVQEISLSVDAYFRLRARQVLRLANQTYYLGQATYFRNDQRQLGGGRNIRGFNENQFFADAYSFATVEYRFLLERDSYLFGFVDGAWLWDRLDQEQIYPMGIGLGMTYGTKAGILSIAYAVGRTTNIAFQPGRGKVHVGFVNQF